MHCNFLINRGAATAADIENLGEEVRARVKAATGVELQWEIKRIGVENLGALPSPLAGEGSAQRRMRGASPPEQRPASVSPLSRRSALLPRGEKERPGI